MFFKPIPTTFLHPHTSPYITSLMLYYWFSVIFFGFNIYRAPLFFHNVNILMKQKFLFLTGRNGVLQQLLMQDRFGHIGL